MFNIIQDMDSSNCLKLNPICKKLIKESQCINILYGILSVPVSIYFCESINENQLLLSANVIELLNIPTTSSYEIYFREPELIIGPFIGILTSVTSEQLDKLVPTLSSYVKYFDIIGGSIVAFSLEGVNQQKGEITGLIYLSKEKRWVKRNVSYPSSILSIIETSLTDNWNYYQQTMDHFHKILDNRIFNFPNFNKWTMYQMLKNKMNIFLPKTKLYTNPSDVLNMLKLYPSIYIKPLNGRLGKFVYKISQNQHGIYVDYFRREKKVNLFKSSRTLSKFLEHVLRNEHYLIQQSIDLFTYDNRIIDFRIMMVKNELGIWENIGTFARYGATNSIVSNISAGGKAEYGVKILQTVFHFSASEAEELLEYLDAIALNALSIVEDHGFHCGNIGFDVGIDTSGKVWIIEMNNQNPDHYIAVKANKSELYYQASLKNILYAKKLAMKKT
ncbi:YheC/YheD family protein [Metabacillus litoralis]|jgi:hypothetical protein|uniref:YheC/YheD family endospore coat-associated protein n=1 Tax=Metabacillus litoralis TaxID=152268 RepID=UPI00203FDFAE|nr:YheC/YheD family protein [Metabacillus litoralis]MCM3655468.1 YheC/YheD family protein [Metabacillus litoralis]